MRLRAWLTAAPLAIASLCVLLTDDPRPADAQAARQAAPVPSLADVGPPAAEGDASQAAPPETAPTNPAPGVDTLSCEATLARIDAALARSDEASWRADELSGLVLVGRHAVDLDVRAAAQGARASGCAERAIRTLRASKTCGRAFGAVSSGMFGSDRFPAETAASMLEGAPNAGCRLLLVQAAQFAANVDDRVARDVERLATTHPDGPDAEQSAWFALGSFELTARRNRQSGLAGRLDALVARSLHESSGDRRLLLLGVAGNAGCRACEGDVAAAAADDDWRVRLAAAGAWRFHESARSVEHMCEPLLGDPDEHVREQAAWALRWSDADDEDRVDCLVTAAATDDSMEVRRAATLSLTLLAPHSALARSGLRHLTSPEYPGEIENIARSYLLALGPVPGDELRVIE